MLAALRAAPGPVTGWDIATQVITLRALPEDPRTTTMIRKRLGAALWKLKAKGMVVEVPQAGDYRGWRLV